MGIASYNITSSINLIIAQRLVRKLCDNCKQEKIFPKSTFVEAGFDLLTLTNYALYIPRGCNKCKDGYSGRMGIFEFLPITKNITQEILQNTSIKLPNNIRDQALQKVSLGLTSLEEINRVIL